MLDKMQNWARRKGYSTADPFGPIGSWEYFLRSESLNKSLKPDRTGASVGACDYDGLFDDASCTDSDIGFQPVLEIGIFK